MYFVAFPVGGRPFLVGEVHPESVGETYLVVFPGGGGGFWRSFGLGLAPVSALAASGYA